MAKKKPSKKKPAKAPAKKAAKNAKVKKSSAKARGAGQSAKKAPKSAALSVPVAGASNIGLRVGDLAPDFATPDQNGKVVQLSSLRGKTVVLYFYPKDMTPGCTQESCDFRDHYSRFQARGALVYGVSKDSPASHQKFIAAHQLPFDLLSDESGKMLEAYGVWKEKSMYGRAFMGIERTTVVITPEGRIQQIYQKVSVPNHVQTVLSAISS